VIRHFRSPYLRALVALTSSCAAPMEKTTNIF
jgi:hypothetical protein